MEKHKNKMGYMPVPKLVVTMSLPLMFSLLVQSLYNIVDGIFVARLSEKALTATSLAYPVQLLMVAISVGTAVGLNAYLSRTVGEKNYKKATRVADTGLVLIVICALVFAVLGALFAHTFANMFTDDAELAAMCGTYLRICMIFCIGSFVQIMAQRFLQAVGDTILSMMSLIIGAVTNIILDPIMIFGLFGFPQLGITGAAIATVTGQWLGGITAIIFNILKNKEVRINFRGFRFEKTIIKEIYKVGFPSIVMQAMGSLMVSCINMILMPFSATAVAFFGVYYKLQSFLFMPMNGLGQAVIPIIGFNFGAKQYERIGQVYRTMLAIAIGISTVAILIFMIIPGPILSLFSASGDMLEIGIPALRIISVTFIFSSVTMVLGYSATGLGNGVINMLGTALRQFILYVPFTYLFARIGGIEHVWYAIWISETVAVIYSILSVKRIYKAKVLSHKAAQQ
ncbi:MAG: MATE family efflux transporter [Candidatus Ornithomonoglobus sp.]